MVFWPPEKAGEAKVRVRVRALTVMDLALMSQPGFPRGEVTERSEDQGEGKGPHRYGPYSPSRRCVLHRGRSVAEGKVFGVEGEIVDVGLVS